MTTTTIRARLHGAAESDLQSFGRERLPELLDISQRKCDYLICTGELPSYKVGKRRLVRAKDLHEFIQARLGA